MLHKLCDFKFKQIITIVSCCNEMLVFPIILCIMCYLKLSNKSVNEVIIRRMQYIKKYLWLNLLINILNIYIIAIT